MAVAASGTLAFASSPTDAALEAIEYAIDANDCLLSGLWTDDIGRLAHGVRLGRWRGSSSAAEVFDRLAAAALGIRGSETDSARVKECPEGRSPVEGG